MDVDSEIISKEQLRERELIRLFQAIEDEMNLIQASAKFNYTINKTSQKETEIILAYTDDARASRIRYSTLCPLRNENRTFREC